MTYKKDFFNSTQKEKYQQELGYTGQIETRLLAVQTGPKSVAVSGIK